MFRRFGIALRWIQTALPAVVGLGFVFTNVANMWLRAGVAVLMCSLTLRRVLLFDLTNPSRTALGLRISAAAYAIAGCLCGVGSIVWGGAIGWFGVFLSLWYGLRGWLMLSQAAGAIHIEPTPPPEE
jgi:hypothetical protein